MRDREHRELRPPDLLAEMGYETEDLESKKFIVGAAWMFGFLVVCSFLVLGLIQYWFPKAPAPSIVSQRRIPETPAPLLQSNVTRITDMQSLRRKETAVLENPAVVDEGRGIYRIPVERAIDILAERGLPETKGAPSAQGGTGGR